MLEGPFTMHDGAISGNETLTGGGVFLGTSPLTSNFIFTGGIISYKGPIAARGFMFLA